MCSVATTGNESNEEVKVRYEDTQRRFHTVVNRQAFNMLRKYNRLTIRSLAKRADVSHGIVGDLASGRRATCNPETATAIEKALDADPNTIFLVQVLPVAVTRNVA
ncbi:hypothetical protein CXR25_14080 [Brevibacterium aurantiacum]|nr:hypothetical protein CXR25_14080 [Brevibacterium aurantiacum]